MKKVWVESNAQGLPIRIFTSKSVMFPLVTSISRGGGYTFQMERKAAISGIRAQVFVRCQDHCELCGAFVTENGPDHKGDLHERVWRGDGGEISLENSIFVCRRCHNKAHSGRSPQFLKK